MFGQTLPDGLRMPLTGCVKEGGLMQLLGATAAADSRPQCTGRKLAGRFIFNIFFIFFDKAIIRRPRPWPRQGRRLGPPQVWNFSFLASQGHTHLAANSAAPRPHRVNILLACFILPALKRLPLKPLKPCKLCKSFSARRTAQAIALPQGHIA